MHIFRLQGMPHLSVVLTEYVVQEYNSPSLFVMSVLFPLSISIHYHPLLLFLDLVCADRQYCN